MGHDIDDLIDRIAGLRLELAKRQVSETSQRQAIAMGGLKDDMAVIAMSSDPKAALLGIEDRLQVRLEKENAAQANRPTDVRMTYDGAVKCADALNSGELILDLEDDHD